MPKVTWCENGCRRPVAGKVVTVNEHGATVYQLCKYCRASKLRPPRKPSQSGTFSLVGLGFCFCDKDGNPDPDCADCSGTGRKLSSS